MMVRDWGAEHGSGRGGGGGLMTMDHGYQNGMSALEILCSVATHPAGSSSGADMRNENSSEGTLESLVPAETKSLPAARRPRTSMSGKKSHGELSLAIRLTICNRNTEFVCDTMLFIGAELQAQRSIQHVKRIVSASTSPSAGPRSSRRQSYTRFSQEEERYLAEGVSQFGVGSWKKILMSFPFHGKRTPVDLKDKYRNMTRMRLKHKRLPKKTLDQVDHESEVSNNCEEHEECRGTAARTPQVLQARAMDLKAH
uniref:Myb-like domain-containing protein n=1 Tax=Rhodosorus marinus TaxID=101924 RepID=A0A7S2ZJS5_9RHOD